MGYVKLGTNSKFSLFFQKAAQQLGFKMKESRGEDGPAATELEVSCGLLCTNQ